LYHIFHFVAVYDTKETCILVTTLFGTRGMFL